MTRRRKAQPKAESSLAPGEVPIATEQWLAEHLGFPALFDGVTTIEERRERVRNEILERGLGSVVAGKRGTQAITWAQTFQRAYDVPLGDDQRA